MSNYFHAYRIDHILGFFRIWEMPATATGGAHPPCGRGKKPDERKHPFTDDSHKPQSEEANPLLLSRATPVGVLLQPRCRCVCACVWATRPSRLLSNGRGPRRAGLLGRFRPSLPITRDELRSVNLEGAIDRL